MSEHETEMMELLQRMQQQLTFLEKKVDTLLQQTQPRPSFNRERNFSRPFRPPFGRPNHHSDGHGPSQGHGPDRGAGRPHRGDRPREGNFAPKKKYFGGQGTHGGGNHPR